MSSASYALRNHIPIAGTGNREPCDGSESPFRVSLGFTPQWFYKRLGIDFPNAGIRIRFTAGKR